MPYLILPSLAMPCFAFVYYDSLYLAWTGLDNCWLTWPLLAWPVLALNFWAFLGLPYL
ncbi:putative membrane protein, partial [Chlamydia psittaci 84-8471/1]